MLVKRRMILALVLVFATADGFTLCPTHRPLKFSRSLRMSDPSKATVSRRNLLGVALGSAVGGLPLGVLAAPSGLSQAQAPLQDRLSPGHWLGQLLGVNSHSEMWQIDASPEDVTDALAQVLEGLTEKDKSMLLMPNYEIAEKTDTKLRVRTWTKFEWLDVLEISCVEAEDGGCLARISFYATGFLPTSIPGAPLLNVALAPMPFASPAPTSAEYPVEFRGGMLQSFRVKRLKDMVADQLETDVELAPKICKTGDYAKENFVSCWSMLLLQG